MIKKLDISWFEAIYAIMEEAFPYAERRNKDEQRKLFALPQYEVYGLIEQDTLLAFLAIWDLKTIRFGEHLACIHTQRGNGLGRQLFQWVEAQSDQPLVFEVELPNREIAKRRIAFYERLGYYLYHDIDYYQGNFHQEQEHLPLRLMMNDPNQSKADIDRIIDLIYEQVYQQKRWF